MQVQRTAITYNLDIFFLRAKTTNKLGKLKIFTQVRMTQFFFKEL